MWLERIITGGIWTTAIVLAAQVMQPDTSLALPAARAVAVSVTPLPLDPDAPSRRQLGELAFAGALHLRATDPGLGGISGLRAGPGGAMLAVTDTGNWVAFDTVETDGTLTGIANVRMAAIPGLDGSGAPTKADGDAEALEWDPAAGTAIVSHEQQHRLMHFTGAPLAMRAVRDERLTLTMGWPPNGGGEALAVLPAGRLWLPEEVTRGDGQRLGLWTSAGATREVGIPGIDGFRPTDAVMLDATHILLLHRRFTPFDRGAAITLLDMAPVIAGGDTASARLLARWQPPLTMDNMEGIAVRTEPGGTAIYVVSDDNFNGMQRTILMKFRYAATGSRHIDQKSGPAGLPNSGTP